jgi:hypothetical protein
MMADVVDCVGPIVEYDDATGLPLAIRNPSIPVFHAAGIDYGSEREPWCKCRWCGGMSSDAESIRHEEGCDVITTRAAFVLIRSELAAAQEREEQCRMIVFNAPELNMNNYDYEQVRALNNAMIEIYQVLHPVETKGEHDDGR